MINITFLGTGCMQPTKTRNQSGILLQYKEEGILFDCGEGIQRQMRMAGVKPAKVSKVLISHWHGDHVFGIPGLLSAIGVDKPGKKIEIYGPKGTKKYLQHMLASFAAKEITKCEVKEVQKGIIFENAAYLLEAYPLKHSVPCIGYSFREKDRRRINVVKAEKLGLRGPILGELQQGRDVVTNGKKIKAAEVTLRVQGKKVSYVADTVPCAGAEKLAQGADLLISEGTHLDDIREKTKQFMHLTVKQAALIAGKSGAKRLVITHLSQRYKGAAEVLQEARTHFENSVVAEDFMRIMV